MNTLPTFVYHELETNIAYITTSDKKYNFNLLAQDIKQCWIQEHKKVIIDVTIKNLSEYIAKVQKKANDAANYILTRLVSEIAGKYNDLFNEYFEFVLHFNCFSNELVLSNEDGTQLTTHFWPTYIKDKFKDWNGDQNYDSLMHFTSSYREDEEFFNFIFLDDFWTSPRDLLGERLKLVWQTLLFDEFLMSYIYLRYKEYKFMQVNLEQLTNYLIDNISSLVMRVSAVKNGGWDHTFNIHHKTAVEIKEYCNLVNIPYINKNIAVRIINEIQQEQQQLLTLDYQLITEFYDELTKNKFTLDRKKQKYSYDNYDIPL